MLEFALQLKSRNETLFYFGLLCFVFAMIFLLLAKTTTTQVYQVNAWYKPFKFAFSTFTFAWAMAWYCHYLPSFSIQGFNWTLIVLLGFEIIYISAMAAQGKESHYNVSSPFFSLMFSMMALAATLVTLYSAYVGFLFFLHDFPDLPTYYLWAIRMGIMLFVIFSFEGFLMGGKMSHSVGLVNDNSNIFILGWSKTVGDLRVAHFLGMHALQALPILAFYIFKNTKLTLLAGILYAALAVFTLIQALNGKPLFTEKSTSTPTQHPNQI